MVDNILQTLASAHHQAATQEQRHAAAVLFEQVLNYTIFELPSLVQSSQESARYENTHQFALPPHPMQIRDFQAVTPCSVNFLTPFTFDGGRTSCWSCCLSRQP